MAEPRKAKEDVPAWEVWAMSSGWLAGLPAVSAIRAEDGWIGRENLTDCLHDEGLVSSATALVAGDSMVGKVA